jgi:glycosyltransferase involved in cell wall biosynthesis
LAEDVAESGAGISVEPEPGAIAAGMLRVMADDAVRQAMAVRASALAADRYSVAAMGRNLKRLYERILG